MSELVKTQRQAAQQVGIPERKFSALKTEAGFPDYSNGYDVVAIIQWLEDRPADESDNEPDDGKAAAADESDNEPASNQPEIRYVTIEIPVCEPTGFISTEGLRGAVSSHVDARVSDEMQLLGLRHGHAGCIASHKQLNQGEGPHVDSRADYIKYVLEQIGKQLIR